MSDNSKIEWTDATWNVVLGCDRVSPGCDSCYAIRTANRMQSNPHPAIADAYTGIVEQRDGRLDWTGQVNLVYDRLELPLRWKKPRRIFVNAQSDLFHADVPDGFIGAVFDVMQRAHHHTFQILTKRPGRMRSLLNRWAAGQDRWLTRFRPSGDGSVVDGDIRCIGPWEPPRNVWLGVSVEDQQRADLRIPALLDTPAAVRFLSCEPLLGPVDLDLVDAFGFDRPAGVDWVIVGGESGPAARPMHPDWARQLRDQCAASGVPFMFKQWGGRTAKAGGRELDGRTWDEFPAVAS